MRTCKWHILQETSITTGVPQGSILGLFCFAFLLMTCLCASHVHQCNVSYLCMLAPLTQLTTIRRDLQQNSNDISGRCCRNLMALNLNKTKRMLMATIQKHQKQQLSLNLNFETTPIEQVLKHRLLGVTVDEQLKWQTHINICRTISRNICLHSKLSQTVNFQYLYFHPLLYSLSPSL